MNIFMTNATGYVGAVIARALLARGHAVRALVRSEASVHKARGIGVEPVRGDLADLDAYLSITRSARVVIHTAFEYFDDGRENAELDIRVSHALINQMEPGCFSHFVYTSNAYLPGVSEERGVEPVANDDEGGMHVLPWRLQLEREILAHEGRGLVTSVIRPGMVYGGLDGGTIGDLIDAADRSGRLAWPEGRETNRWSLVHQDDLAALYVHVVERGAGGVFHAVDGQPLPVERVMSALSTAVGVPSGAATAGCASAILSNHAFGMTQRDVALGAPRAFALGWQPRFADFEQGVGTVRAAVPPA